VNRIFCTPQNKIGSYRVLRGIFWPKKEKATREWRKLHNEELNDLRVGQRRDVNRVLVGKPEGKRPLERPSST
jgi:hypothetical protein